MLAKTPRSTCTASSHYDVLDLQSLTPDYLPRSNYARRATPAVYEGRTPKVTWGDRRPITAFYRLVHREMLNPTSERTFVCCVLPPEIAHVNTCLGHAFASIEDLLAAAATFFSIAADFRVKSTGMGHASTSLVRQLPILHRGTLHCEEAVLRVALLVSLSPAFSPFWKDARKDFPKWGLVWTRHDDRLGVRSQTDLEGRPCFELCLRSDYERRQALVELDVLTSMAIGLSLEELIGLYRVQFPILQHAERATWYDRSGRIAFTENKGLTGLGVDRQQWTEVRHREAGTVDRTVTDDTLPGGPRERTITYVAPFDRCDREADYRAAWQEFERRAASAGRQEG